MHINNMNQVQVTDLGWIEYGKAWDMQEAYMQDALKIKSAAFQQTQAANANTLISNRLLLCTHPHVYTLGKSGFMENLLINDERMKALEVTFYKTNRGGDITYHGPGQLVAYPILDLEQFRTDLGWYMRSLEEVIIRTIAEYGITAGRLEGSTGVWLDVGTPQARKICAMGVKSSRWITIHGLALNMNTNLQYFNHIVPCGIVDKGVTSMQQELGTPIDEAHVKTIMVQKFADVFDSNMILQPA
jgi:lipoyl(octanoyl) transferase